MNSLNWILPFIMYFSTGGNTEFHAGNRNERKNYVAVNLAFEANSNSINAEMLRYYLRGRYIYDDMKNRSFQRMKSTNRLGADACLELSAVVSPDSMFKKKGWSYYIALKSRFIFHSSFNKDLFSLAFYGNAPFAGDTLNMGSPQATYLQYQQASFGLIKTIQKPKSTHTLGFALSYLNGNSFFNTNVSDARLYTAPQGEILWTSINGSFSQSNTSKNRFFYPNGYGAGLDLLYRWNDKDKNQISFSVTDLGFIAWSPFSQKTSIDTSLSFSGVNVPNVLKLNDDFFRNLGDSVNRAFDNKTHSGNDMMFTPVNVNLSYSRIIIPHKLVLVPSVNMKFFANYFPMFSLTAIGYPNAAVSVAGTIRYGGWGGINAGLEFGFDAGSGWVITAGSRTLDGYFLERNNSGLALNFGLVKYFNKPSSKSKKK